MQSQLFSQFIHGSASVLLVAMLTACGGDDSSPDKSTASSSVLSSSSQAVSSGSNSSGESNSSIPVAVENSGSDCVIPALADYAALETIDALPDPFLSLNKTRISKKSDWRCRRAEIGAQAQKYELGAKPAAPEHITGSVNRDTLTVTMEEGEKTLSFDVQIILPDAGKPPYPAMIGMGGVSLDREELSRLGVAIIDFPNNQLAEQINADSRGKGSFYDFYGSDHSAGAMMAWAWGVSRLIDALATTAGTQINAKKLGITGCSRNGKGAIVAGAFDERLALTIAQESGSGGAASWRVSDAQMAAGQTVQTLSEIVNENVWFADHFRMFSTAATKLPFDHHSLMGMIAPRGLLVIENSIEWLGIESTYTTSVAAQEIWKALGVADHMGVSQTREHPHCQQPASQQPEITAFVQKFLWDQNKVDTSIDTNVVKTEADITVDKERWINWTTPNLQ